MTVIYVDNFRGFSDTYISLKDVNFLVGENSTGKTSILSLIKLLSEPGFLTFQDFNMEEINLGVFNEIADKGTKHFKIGICNYNEKSKMPFITILLTFINKDGIPVISEVCYINKNYEIKIIIQKNGLKYKYKKIDIDKYLKKDILTFFKSWATGDNLRDIDYRDISVDYDGSVKLFHLFMTINEEIREIGFPLIFSRSLFNDSVTWIAPIRAKPKRIYDSYEVNYSSDGNHIPYLLKNMMTNKSTKEEFINLIEAFGSESGMFKSIEVNSFGNDKTSPFEININSFNKYHKISNVGYGVSQVLPIIAEIAQKKQKWFAVQQPEVHLHPKAQAALGQYLFHIARTYKHKLLIETHSDYTIDRFRTCIRDHKKLNFSAQILFFQRSDEGNKVYPIEIEKNGQYSEDQPQAFREFFIKEELNILGLEL